MELFSPLSPWIERKAPEPPFRDISKISLDADVGCGVVLDVWVPIHTAHTLEARSLTDVWHDTRSYFAKACAVISADEPLPIDREESEMILEHCGKPPHQAYPLYFMTTRDGEGDETIVYIGKSSSKTRRFSGGHSAISKLHDPKFSAMEKRLYLGCVTFMDKAGDYVPLEMIQPLASAKALLADLEMQLIYHFQPELNTAGKPRRHSKSEQIIHLQGLNDWKSSHFLFPGQSYNFEAPDLGPQNP